jgi:hypothetical protein
MLVVLVIVILVFVITKKKKKKIIRCDGCKEVVEGKFIRITEAHLSRPLDYCSEECKLKYLDQHRVDFADMEVE